jgi:secreted PhoX family phosphatase
MFKRKFSFGLLAAAGFLALSAVTAAQDAKVPTVPSDNPYYGFIASHDAAIAKGATAEWRKLEGVAMDPANKKVYYAVTEIGKGMSDDKGDLKLTANPCGAIFEGSLDADYNLSEVKAVVLGGKFNKEAKADQCDVNSISNPDNIFVDSKGNLWIGEDTDFHANQVLWMWDGKELKRFATMPKGAEVTGLRVQPDGTIFLNVQHPDPMNPYPFNRGTVGVINGYKAGDAFTPVEVPTGDATTSLHLAAGTYQVLGRAGDAIPNAIDGSVFGAITAAADGKPLFVCDNPDGNMFLPTTSAGTEGYLYSNWECSPGGVSQLYIKQNGDTWNVIEGSRVDFTGVGGTTNNCNASVTPWNTALTSEEYPPDVAGELSGYTDTQAAIEANIGGKANIFQTGNIIELKPSGGEDGAIGTSVTRLYTLGRFSKEMALVMPDSKTVYFGDDGTDRVLYKFVADTAEDLTAGTLYAAKITQDGETLKLNWLELGKGKNDDIAKAVAELAPKS